MKKEIRITIITICSLFVFPIVFGIEMYTIEIPNKYLLTLFELKEEITLPEAYYYLTELREGRDIFINGINIKANGKGDIRFDKDLLRQSNSHFEMLFKAIKGEDVYAFAYTRDYPNNITPAIQSYIQKLLITNYVNMFEGYFKIRITK